MERTDVKPLIIFEMANNHGGSLQHGLDIIDSIHEVTEGFGFDFAFKFQFRAESYIHPRFRGKSDPPYVKRFEETRLLGDSYEVFRIRVKSFGWKAICTPFDEQSVELIESLGFDYIKIASCSLTDWPLLERIGESKLPVIASTAGATLEEIDRVVLFFETRKIPLSLLHCVGEYPAPGAHWQLNQIDVLRERYPDLRIGLSHHGEPGLLEAETIAIAKGASIHEIHVDLHGHHELNRYSWGPESVRGWLHATRSAIESCGVVGQRHQSTEKEQADLRKFKRGVYASRDILEGETLDETNIICAYPNQEHQLVANDLSKYTKFTAKTLIVSGEPIWQDGVEASDTRPLVVAAINKVRELLIAANVKLPDGCDMELSHHRGLERFDEVGCTIFSVINREYCKKVIVVLSGQQNPWHFHVKKEETFLMIYGDVRFHSGKKCVCTNILNHGDMLTIKREEEHAFDSPRDSIGGIFEEISTTHYVNDSFYLDETIMENQNRKTRLKFRSAWLERPVR